MAIKKYSLVKIIKQNKIGYVQEIIDGKLWLANFDGLFENDPEEIREIIFDDLSTQEICDTNYQIKILHEIFANEARRRIYDIEKNGKKSKFYDVNFIPPKK